ncbi:MAG: J domain-containing protein [Actinobacteria bacterium]|nr:J domain-containing protein [Actinomycetota bacterium]
MTDYYRILEVHQEASQEVIEKAYKALSMKYHPDKHLLDEKRQATRKMQELNEAYGVLSDPLKRLAYDRERSTDFWQIWLEYGLLGVAKIWLKEK